MAGAELRVGCHCGALFIQLGATFAMCRAMLPPLFLAILRCCVPRWLARFRPSGHGVTTMVHSTLVPPRCEIPFGGRAKGDFMSGFAVPLLPPLLACLLGVIVLLLVRGRVFLSPCCVCVLPPVH